MHSVQYIGHVEEMEKWQNKEQSKSRELKD